MASSILHHPFSCAVLESSRPCDHDTYSTEEILQILELENAFVMDIQRLENVINGTSYSGSAGHIRGYLAGIYDSRRMLGAVRPDLLVESR
jgi:hypothetical protein